MATKRVAPVRANTPRPQATSRTVTAIGGIKPTGPAVSGVSGTVVDEKGAGLEFANIVFYSPDNKQLNGLQADINGKFRGSVPPGTQYMKVTFVGYGEKKIEPLPTAPITIKMRQGSELDAVTVTAKAYKWINKYGMWLILGGVVFMILLAAYFSSRRGK